ncbi:hypothetical protein PGIN_84-3_00404 [Porphyromonas gingivalis]|nr:hypothetical protein PGIN_84-3_00404 [Porphyromonas gingivalis]
MELPVSTHGFNTIKIKNILSKICLYKSCI